MFIELLVIANLLVIMFFTGCCWFESLVKIQELINENV